MTMMMRRVVLSNSSSLEVYGERQEDKRVPRVAVPKEKGLPGERAAQGSRCCQGTGEAKRGDERPTDSTNITRKRTERSRAGTRGVGAWLTPWPTTTAPLGSSVGGWGRRWGSPLAAAPLLTASGYSSNCRRRYRASHLALKAAIASSRVAE